MLRRAILKTTHTAVRGALPSRRIHGQALKQCPTAIPGDEGVDEGDDIDVENETNLPEKAVVLQHEVCYFPLCAAWCVWGPACHR